jgi:hypothetical protein
LFLSCVSILSFAVLSNSFTQLNPIPLVPKPPIKDISTILYIIFWSTHQMCLRRAGLSPELAFVVYSPCTIYPLFAILIRRACPCSLVYANAISLSWHASLKINSTMMPNINTNCLEREGMGASRCAQCKKYDDALSANVTKVLGMKRTNIGKSYRYTSKVTVASTPQIIQRREAFTSRSRASMLSASSQGTTKRARPCGSDTTSYKVPPSDEFKTKEHTVLLNEDGQAKHDPPTAPRPTNLLEQQYATMSTPRALISDIQGPEEAPVESTLIVID